MITGTFRRLSIRGKLTAILMLTSSVALVVSSASYMVWDHFRFRSDVARELSTQAQMVLDNTAAAISFGDPDAARETLATVSPNRQILAACLYDATGALFAEFRRSPETVDCPPQSPPVGYAFTASGIELTANKTIGAQRGGSVYFRGDLQEVTARLKAQAVTMSLVLLVALAVALILSASLQRVVSEPVEVLAAIARAVSERGDYSLRARKTTDDELGLLVDAFNGMLSEIQQQVTEEQEANRLKDEFLASLSHELRTPLNAILGWLQILHSNEDPEITQRALASIDRNARSQARLIEDLVDVSRIVTGKLQVKADVVDLREVVEAAAEAIGPAARDKGVKMATLVPPAPSLVTGDPVRLQQVVSNVLGNAVKFTPAEGQVRLSLAAVGKDHVIEVADTGVGISPAFLPHVFERFRQADGSVTREHGGLGLGLAIVRELLVLHSGDVSVESAGLGRGTTFRIRLPQLIPASEASTSVSPSRQARSDEVQGVLGGVRVLVADDDEDSREIAARVLRESGAQVKTVNSGQAAIAEWKRRPSDVLICDLAMPQVDGFAVLRAVRALDAAAGHVTAAIAVTAHASEEFRQRSLAAGFEAHLAKPYEGRVFASAVIAALPRRHPSDFRT